MALKTYDQYYQECRDTFRKRNLAGDAESRQRANLANREQCSRWAKSKMETYARKYSSRDRALRKELSEANTKYVDYQGRVQKWADKLQEDATRLKAAKEQFDAGTTALRRAKMSGDPRRIEAAEQRITAAREKIAPLTKAIKQDQAGIKTWKPKAEEMAERVAQLKADIAENKRLYGKSASAPANL